MITCNLIKSLVVLVLGSAIILILLRLVGIDFERQLLGLGLFILLGGLSLIKELEP